MLDTKQCNPNRMAASLEVLKYIEKNGELTTRDIDIVMIVAGLPPVSQKEVEVIG